MWPFEKHLKKKIKIYPKIGNKKNAKMDFDSP